MNKLHKLTINRRFRACLHLNNSAGTALFLVALALIFTGASVLYRNYMAANINPAAYQPLLNTIAKGESNGNYNAYFANGSNTALRFTDMTIGEVLKWQEDYVAEGSPSSAVGKYQIIRPTLAGLVRQLNIDNNSRFDETLQDRLAVALLEKRGAQDYMRNRLSREQFAANLAQEWAALPRATGSNPEQSYYAGDGINEVQITIDEVYKALGSIKR